MKIGNKNFIKYNEIAEKYQENKEVIYKSAASGELDTYVMHPDTKKPIKVPAELVMKMQAGKSTTLEEIENYKHKN